MCRFGFPIRVFSGKKKRDLGAAGDLCQTMSAKTKTERLCHCGHTSDGTASWPVPAVSVVNAPVNAINPVESGRQGGVGRHGNEEIKTGAQTADPYANADLAHRLASPRPDSC